MTAQPAHSNTPVRSAVSVALMAACLAWLAGGGRAWAGEADAALRIRAAFVLNFLKFTEWPAGALGKDDAEMVLDVVGEDPFAPVLREALDGKTVQGRTLRVHAHRDAAGQQQAPQPCQALFVTAAAAPAWADLRAALADRPVLSIAELPGFCADGGMLNLFEQAGHIKFEANPEAARAAGVQLRAELLKLATIVKTQARRP
jgi:hypothetical protein